jgi:hypothetical protein
MLLRNSNFEVELRMEGTKERRNSVKDKDIKEIILHRISMASYTSL